MTNKFLSTSSDIETTIIKCPLILTPETPLIEAIQLMSQVSDSCDLTLAIAQADVNLLNQLEKYSCILAYKNNKLVGIFTERDIVKSTAMGLNLESATLTDVMNKNPVTLKKSEFINIFVVLNLFHQYKIRHLVIVDDQDNLIGFVTPTTIRQLLQAADLLKIRTIGNVMTSEVIQAPRTTSVLYSLDPLEMYDTVNFLQNKIYQLESEKIEILEKQNTELETQVQERTSKLIEPANVNKLLATLSEKIRNFLDIEYILQTTVSEIQEYLQIERVIIYEFESGECGKVVAESLAPGITSILGRIIGDSCFAERWLQPYINGRVGRIEDIYTAELPDCYFQLLNQVQIRANLVVPIVYNN